MNCSVWDVISGEVEMLQRGYNNARTTSSYKNKDNDNKGPFDPFHSTPMRTPHSRIWYAKAA